MDITPIIPINKNIINSYSSEYCKVNNKKYYFPLLITPDTIFSKKLELENLEFLPTKIEILLIGIPDQQIRIADAIIAILKKEEIIFEIMNIGAAFRTYNVLLAEGRNIAVWCL